MNLHRISIVLTTVLLLTACGGGPAVVPVSERPTKLKPQALIKDEYQVSQGDTLYSIAFATSHDYRDLATWNQIGAPYVIYPGQKLVLKQPPADPNAVAIAQPLATATGSVAEPSPEPLDTNSLPEEDVSGDGTFVSVPSELSPPAPTPDTIETAAVIPPAQPTQPTPQQAAIIAPATAFNGSWQWPVVGPVIQRFSAANGNKGIDIGGNAGTPVKAAASGKVVYAGSGLRGYGQLVIVQHNDEFLSAYAHNQSLMVNEGDNIRPGQTLGHMGSSGADKVKLHFEIRRNGDPVDPLKLLPRRST